MVEFKAGFMICQILTINNVNVKSCKICTYIVKTYDYLKENEFCKRSFRM
jgi:hypothetical protein